MKKRTTRQRNPERNPTKHDIIHAASAYRLVLLDALALRYERGADDAERLAVARLIGRVTKDDAHVADYTARHLEALNMAIGASA